jgi:hypothetical protein
MSKHDPHYAPEPAEHPTQWHRHTPDEGTPQTEHGSKADPFLLAGIGAVLTVSFVALLVVVMMYYSNFRTKIRQEKIETTLPAAESYAYHEDSLRLLNQGSYAWVNIGQSEAVQVPLDQAIESVLGRYGK